MKKALEILGLEICDAYSTVGGWYFKRINGEWYFATADIWRLLKEEDMQVILKDEYTNVMPIVIPKKKIDSLFILINCSLFMEI